MNGKNRFGVLLTLLVFLSGVLMTVRYFEANAEKRELQYARCADEVNSLVAEFLRTNSEAQKAYTQKGDLVRVAGSGYATPGPWNLQGQSYLSMNRIAVFERGTEQLQIMLMQGDENSVFKPHPEHSMIYVTSPEFSR
jgi:hypothetical protein